MTRGQIAIIMKSKVMTSIEFNGDMYMPTRKWAGHGRTVINALKRIYDVATYQFEVAKFNKDHHHYNDYETLTHERSLDTLDFTKDYFNNWFSDYVYIKNLTSQDVVLKTNKTDKNGNDIGIIEVVLKPSAIAVLCFGTLHKLVETNNER